MVSKVLLVNESVLEARPLITLVRKIKIILG